MARFVHTHHKVLVTALLCGAAAADAAGHAGAVWFALAVNLLWVWA